MLWWLHGIAAGLWVLGVLSLAAALSVRPGVRVSGPRATLASWYRDAGAWLHWALVVAVVGTGSCGLLGADFPTSLGAGAPYGTLYTGIGAAQLALLVLLLVTATGLTGRLMRGEPRETAGGAVRVLLANLGPVGVAYVLLAPALLGLVVALRYVYVLSAAAS